MPEPALEIDRLFFQYPLCPGLSDHPLFQYLSLRLQEGEIGLLLGKPDSGKTTLMRLCLGLLPRYGGGSREGNIRIFGAQANSLLPGELVEIVGSVFQNPEEQLLTTRCDTEAAFPLESLGLPREEIKDRVGRSLDNLGLSSMSLRAPSSLSGGEKKKLLLACMEAVGPGFWIFDETLEELDPDSKKSALRLLRERSRAGLILSAKWHPEFSEVVNRFFLLEAGRVIEITTPTESPAFREFLEAKGFMIPKDRMPSFAGRTGPREPERLLSVQDIRFRYPGNAGFRLEIDDLSLYRGRICALVGGNGSGKSTLARILAGLLVPQEGRVEWTASATSAAGGSSAAGETASPQELNRRCAYLFQNPDHQIFLPTVREELAFGLGLRGREAESRIQEAAHRFRLPDLQAPPVLMGYGARKRLQAGVYYLLDRPLVILDEADSGLSLEDFASILQQFADPGRAILLITHDPAIAMGFADSMVHLEEGRVILAAERDGRGRLQNAFFVPKDPP